MDNNKKYIKRSSDDKSDDRRRIHNITEDVSSGALAHRQEQEAERIRHEEERRQVKKRHLESLERRRRIRKRRKIRRILIICLLIVVAVVLVMAVLSLAHFNTGSRHDAKGMTAYEDGDYDTAVQEFKEAISYNEQDADYHTHLGMTYIETGSWEEALGYFSQAESCAENDGQLCRINRGRAIAYIGQGNYEAAVDACSTALSYAGNKNDKLRSDILFYMAEAQEKAGNFSQAVDSYTAIYDGTGDDGALLLRGMAYSQMEQYEAAEADLRKSIQENRRSYGIYMILFDTLQAQGKSEEAKEVLQDALTLSGNSGEANYYRGMIYLKLEDYENAAAMFDTSVEKEYLPALIGQSILAAEKGDYETAAARCESFFAENTSEDAELLAKAYNQYAVCLLQLGRYEEAAAACGDGLSYSPRLSDETLRLNLTAAYEYMGDWENAYAAAKTLYEKYPGSQEAEKEFQFLESRVLN